MSSIAEALSCLNWEGVKAITLVKQTKLKPGFKFIVWVSVCAEALKKDNVINNKAAAKINFVFLTIKITLYIFIFFDY